MKSLFHLTPIKSSLLSFFLFLNIFQGNCQTHAIFQYKEVPNEYKVSQAAIASCAQKADSAKAGAYDLTVSLPAGYVTDGTVDYTTYLQQGLNTHTNVVFPDFPVLISPKGLQLKSNSSLVFLKKSKLIVAPNSQSNYQALRLANVQNVAIYNPVIEGDREKHTSTQGEWGMGIWIAGSTNIKIYHARITNCWGDGIYVGKGAVPSKNIGIYYAELDNNRRNGLSIVSVDGLLVQSPIISNTNGTMPMSAIDIEPNNNADEANNIDIENAITYNNVKHGIFISLDRLAGNQAKTLGIHINKHVDDGSGIGFGYHNLTSPEGKKLFTGQVDISNASWKNNKTGYSMYKSYKNGADLKFTNVTTLGPDSIGTKRTRKLDNNSVNKLLQ